MRMNGSVVEMRQMKAVVGIVRRGRDER